MATMTNKRIEKFRDEEYRHSYAASLLDTFIATQIRVLREQREWTQAQLAERTGMKQSRISAIEDANYSGWSTKTLKRLARAFDVPLLVSFGTFGRLLGGLNEFNRADLERPTFDNDPAFALDARLTQEGSASSESIRVAHTGRVIPFHGPLSDDHVTTSSEGASARPLTEAVA
jgi:transcriptional regulator with XRE-family HTH domain